MRGRRTPEPRATLSVLGLAVLLGALCWYLGTDVWHSILIGGAVTTVGLVVVIANGDPDLGMDRAPTVSGANREGSRRDVDELSASLRESWGRVGGRAVWRLAQLARVRLAERQLDLKNPADRAQIEALIGRRAYRVLDRGQHRAPFLRSYVHCLDALEALRTDE